MKLCQKCKKEIAPDNFIGRQAQCPSCGADLHCCLNCTFYDRGSYNNCLEPQAERVLDKSRSNFCDFSVLNWFRKTPARLISVPKTSWKRYLKKALNKSAALILQTPLQHSYRQQQNHPAKYIIASDRLAPLSLPRHDLL